MTDENGNIVVCTWTEDGVEVISKDLALCQGMGLAVVGSDIYVAGNEAAGFDWETYEELNYAHIWKNGEMQPIETISPNDFSIWGIACALTGSGE